MTVLTFPFARTAYKGSAAFPDQIFRHRPLIPVTLSFMNQRATILAIADSGSDRTIFNTEVARLLGITIQRGTMETFSGTSGHKQVVYYHPLKVEIRSGSLAISYEAKIGFALLPRDIAGLLGQVGFFDHFEVTLNQQSGLVILRHSA